MSVSRRAFGAGLMAAAASGPGAAGAATRGKATYGEFGLDLAAMDRSVTPGEDFYRYVNGTWLKTSQIPADMSRWHPYDELTEINRQRVKGLLEAAGSAPAGTIQRKVGDYYAAQLDQAERDRSGFGYLKPQLDRIAAVNSPALLAQVLADLNRKVLDSGIAADASFTGPPVRTGVSVDLKDPKRYLPSLGQGGLSLPDRDYYLTDRSNYPATRAAYVAHVARLFTLAGFSEPEARAGRVAALETRLARSHRSTLDNRQVEKRYNLWSLDDFTAKAPGLDWGAFLKAAGFAGQTTFLVAQPEAMAGVAAAAGEAPLGDWRDYLAARTIRNFASCGPQSLVDEHFSFYGKVLSGQPELAASWKRASQATDAALGAAVGQMYINAYFTSETRARAQEVADNIRAAMGRRISAATWMGPKTKQRALTKLKTTLIEIGAEKPRNYDKLIVGHGIAWGNLLRTAEFDYDRDLAKLGRPVDRGEWNMYGHTVNGQSNQVLRKVMIPAGILQPPVFDAYADPAVNYAAVGRLMGHELSHQFDDQGSKFDEVGALKDWWQPEDYARFKASSEALASQYDSYQPLSDMHIDGHLTLGENIGDLAGLNLAYDAYHASLKGKPAPVLGGFTGDQRFFMSFNQVYRTLQREPNLRRQLATDPHSPSQWRAAEVRNLNAWYAAFEVKPGMKDYLAPADRVRVW
jgi:putative endopeptidase